MTGADPRLSKLAKLIALFDDAAATEGERANCLRFGQKIAAELGMEFSRAAIEAGTLVAKPHTTFDSDADEWVRQWTAMTPAQREEELRDMEEMLRRSTEQSEKRQAEREAMAREHDALMERLRVEKEDQKQAKQAERARIKRVKAGQEPPQWDDLNRNHLAWLERIEALELTDDDRALVSRARAGVRDNRLGLFGEQLHYMNRLLARAFGEVRADEPRR